VKTARGQHLDLKAVPAPTPAAAAEFYPGVYWYSMLQIPDKNQFPAPERKQRHRPVMKTQAQWIDTVKNSCQSAMHWARRASARFPRMGTLR